MFFEALALGRPVISTYIAAHPELIEPGVNGWLVPAGAVEPLVDAMAEALTAEPAELERMGRAGAGGSRSGTTPEPRSTNSWTSSRSQPRSPTGRAPPAALQCSGGSLRPRGFRSPRASARFPRNFLLKGMARRT